MSLRGVLNFIPRANYGLLCTISPCRGAPAAVLRHSSGSTERISRYPVPNRKNLPFDIVELMEEVEQKGGFLPNVFKVLSHRPAEFRAFFSYYNALMNKGSGGLSKSERELIVVATSAHNHCLYCVVAVNPQAADLSPREKAMLDFALKVCRCETITDEHFSSLEAHGFDREDVWDIAAIAAFFALSNRMAHLTDMRPNAEFYTMGRVPRDKEKASEGRVQKE
ncbi:hypothetical protein DNTS_014652 [Danionella cerebrum]|uniref:Carboxymuconolactone decarboxylase-like domain-containing protein n=1 Tax=Danionella cerebrum TaxID=2873325 RepID=A0A553Q1U1_9TELE|nr:hypothetical protein DNTS_014652 [Danionella translucida]